MFLIGVCIHIIFLLSIFDIYFKSPIVRNVTTYEPLHTAVANRLVLFVVDGLRAESFVNFNTMAKLRHTATFNGKWGISNTRVPTESRPGHVALIAGFYEDPSAVLRGWKENPVDFDSVFNQTKYTWGWGTYDIVEIFTKGTKDDHIIMNKFDPYDQLLRLSQNTTSLDAWVFDHVKEFFDKAKADEILHKKLMEKKIVFFLHLLGTDTSGHTHKPNTENYLTTLRFADSGIKEIENIVRDFYNDDGKTTFLMTSDHGMTNWGSHGAGDNHETETPFVIWGAGVNSLSQEEATTLDGNLPTKNKYVVNQADLAPLMSTILSIPVPVNSVGELPLDLLDLTLEDQSKAIFSNSRQLANQYNKKRIDGEAHANPMLYQPFEPFTSQKYYEILDITERLLENEKYDKVIDLSKEIMHLSLSGLQYYHNYYQRPLLIAVTLSFLGWITFLFKMLLVQSLSVQENKPFRFRNKMTSFNIVMNIKAVIFFIWAVLSVYLVYAQNLPCQYYIYFLLPVLLWWYALTPFDIWKQCFKKYIQKDGCVVLIGDIICYSVGVLAMGLSFTYRWMLSVPLCGMALWPVVSTTRQRLSTTTLALWSCTCCLLGAFTFMPVVGKQVYIPYVIFAGLIWLSIHVLFTWKLFNSTIENSESRKEIILNVFQTILLVLALYNVFVQSRIYDEGLPTSELYQGAAWLIATTALVQPLLHTKRLIYRLSAINTSIFTLYILLSVIHEGLFLVTLAVNASCWVFIEFKKSHPRSAKILDLVYDKSEKSVPSSIAEVDRSVNREDFRRAFFFLLYIIISFFGTGNIASINSFEWRWVACFVSSFHPFLISALVLMKTLCPFLCVASCFRALQHLTKAPTGYLNVIVLIYSNVMGIQLLYNVKNTGSWLEIGTSISQFVIVQVITLFIVLIHQLAILLSDYSIFNLFSNILKSNKKIL